MTIISNVMPLLGVNKTDTILKPALCRLLLTDNARTANLITNNVKKTDHVPVQNQVMSTLVLRDDCTKAQTVVLMTILTVNAVLHRRQPAARQNMP